MTTRAYILTGITMFLIMFSGTVTLSSIWVTAPMIVLFIPVLLGVILAPILIGIFDRENNHKVIEDNKQWYLYEINESR